MALKSEGAYWVELSALISINVINDNVKGLPFHLTNINSSPCTCSRVNGFEPRAHVLVKSSFLGLVGTCFFKLKYNWAITVAFFPSIGTRKGWDRHHSRPGAYWMWLIGRLLNSAIGFWGVPMKRHLGASLFADVPWIESQWAPDKSWPLYWIRS